MTRLAIPVLAAAALTAAAAADTTTVDFESGAEGWVGSGGTSIAAAGGNPGATMQTVFNNFGMTYRNGTNPAFAQDFSVYDSVTFSMDLRIDRIDFFGAPAERPWFVEVRDYDNVPDGWPYVSVWYPFGWFGQSDWTTHTVTIDDPSSKDLPAGWFGYGAEDPDTFEPILPANRTFADVLAGADELVYSTLQPGWFFGFTDFELRLDNFTVTTEGGGAQPGDANGDGVVDFDDLLAVLSSYGPCDGPCPADFDGNGQVDFDDLITVLVNWG